MRDFLNIFSTTINRSKGQQKRKNHNDYPISILISHPQTLMLLFKTIGKQHSTQHSATDICHSDKFSLRFSLRQVTHYCTSRSIHSIILSRLTNNYVIMCYYLVQFCFSNYERNHIRYYNLGIHVKIASCTFQ